MSVLLSWGPKCLILEGERAATQLRLPLNSCARRLQNTKHQLFLPTEPNQEYPPPNNAIGFEGEGRERVGVGSRGGRGVVRQDVATPKRLYKLRYCLMQAVRIAGN